MGIRDNFQKLIDKKQQEIEQLELQIRETGVYIQALQDSMKFLPRDSANSATADHTLRPDSALAKARDAIRAAGAPLPIAEILKAIGKPQDKKSRVSLAGTLSGYVRQGKVFTKTAPNTFGLLEFGNNQPEAPGEGDDLPGEFGNMQ
jgi:hypothetical protein